MSSGSKIYMDYSFLLIGSRYIYGLFVFINQIVQFDFSRLNKIVWLDFLFIKIKYIKIYLFVNRLAI